MAQGYAALAAADPARWAVVDGSESVASVAAAIGALVERRLPGAGGPAGSVIPPVLERLVGQDRAQALLAASLAAPVHAYLFLGPTGSGKREAAAAFAAALVCPEGGCGNCPACRDALAGRHPDVTVVERRGASIAVEEARAVSRAGAAIPSPRRPPGDRPRRLPPRRTRPRRCC